MKNTEYKVYFEIRFELKQFSYSEFFIFSTRSTIKITLLFNER